MRAHMPPAHRAAIAELAAAGPCVRTAAAAGPAALRAAYDE
jgi:hypothetical protein